MDKKISSILTGVAGEYFVAAELSLRGYVASITLRNTKGIDIVASNEEGNKTVNIQVKTNRRKKPQWIMNKKAENIKDKNMFYVLVLLFDDITSPEYYIVPSRDVANYVEKGHKKWLSTPGRGGKMHKDTIMRMFEDLEKRYLNKWGLLGLD